MAGRKRWVLAAIALIAAGILIIAAALAAVGFDFSKLSTRRYGTNVYTVREEFHSIMIDGDTEKIAFLPSEEGGCRVVCREEEQSPHRVGVTDDTLIIENPGKRKWHFMDFSFLTEGPAVTVFLPQAAYRALTVDADTGNVTIPEAFTFDSIRVTLSTGSVALSASAAGSVTIKTSTGRIDLADMRAQSVQLTATTGGIRVINAACANDMEVHVSTGKAALENVTCGRLTSTGSTGSLALTNVIATGPFDLRRSTGSIHLDGCDAETMRISTSTGSVTGTLLTEKSFYARSHTGRVDVPATTGGRCEISTNTGAIRIAIESKTR